MEMEWEPKRGDTKSCECRSKDHQPHGTFQNGERLWCDQTVSGVAQGVCAVSDPPERQSTAFQADTESSATSGLVAIAQEKLGCFYMWFREN